MSTRSPVVQTGGRPLPKVEEGEPSNFGGLSSRTHPRFIARNLPFFQSKNRVNVTHNQGFKIFLLLRHDWFHVLLRMPTWQSVPVLLAAWTSLIIVFAGLYVWVDNKDPDISCGLGAEGAPIDFAAAFAFSLETCTTVGYTLPYGVNSFFEGECAALQAVIYFQMTWSMMFNAFLFAFFYSSLAKCDARGAQLVVANNAIVSVVDGQIRFQVRAYDVDGAHPVVEAHIRMYAVTKDRPVPRQLRILQPDDELGGMLFLSVPTVVSHQVDVYSLLHPPVETPIRPCGLHLRTADSETCNREEMICPVCGESYGTYERWRNHVMFQRIVEEKDDYPVRGTHLSLNRADFAPLSQTQIPPANELKEIEEYFKSEISEVICVIEGIEPIGSGTFSALQSYRFQDIVFHPGARFRPCVEAIDGKNDDGIIRVNLDHFHGIDIDQEAAEAADSLPGPGRKNQRSHRVHDAFFKGPLKSFSPSNGATQENSRAIEEKGSEDIGDP